MCNTILCLTNSNIALPLFDWLKNQNENIVVCESEITPDYIKENGVDFVISYNYMAVIKPEIIELLPHQIINLHISYLPYNRGASPNIWSFIEKTPCGVTIHEIDVGLDTGDILLQEKIDYNFGIETLETTYLKSHEKIQKLFRQNWQNIKENRITPKKQAENGTSHYAKELDKYRDIICYADTIEIFLKKIENFLSYQDAKP